MSPRFAAFQYPDFRRFWIGFAVSISGQQMLWMLEPWLIYEISGSKAFLGINAIAQAVPATALVLLGGVIADKFDQRKVLIAVQAAQIAVLVGLMILALTELLQVWHIFVAAFLRGIITSFENPARQSMFPHLVRPEAIRNAVALSATIHPGTAIGAPVLGGILLALVLGATDSPRIAAGAVLLVAIAAAATYALILAKVYLPPIKRTRSGGMASDMAEGVRFVWRNRIFSILIGLAYYNMFFGISLSVLFPIIAKDVLHTGPDALGVMYGAMGIGSLAGVFAAAHFSGPERQRYMLIGGPLLLGASMIGLAVTPVFWLSLVVLFGVGAGGSVFSVAIQQNVQMLVTNEFRGRVMALWSLVHSSVRPMGEMQFSGIAALVSAPLSLILSGVMVLVGAAFLVTRGPTQRLIDLKEAPAEPLETSVSR
ncbi:MAG TPA: MFS transporter [Chloroflexota bacterium]|jgi:MFS family permease